MNRLRFTLKLTALAAALGCGLLALQGPATLNAQPPGGGGEPEVLTRGPIHEAYAEPIVFNPKPGLIIGREPPAVIEEMPPDEKPEGENVGWIGGYWSFEDERKDFIWTSGFWRVLPPNRQWIAGSWVRVDTGWQWTSGYWAPVTVTEAEYLPTPPDTLEAGASTESPSADHIYIPGTWRWYETRYVWQPGYHIVNNAGWMWCPAHYVWSPCGCVYVDGYWDWSIRRRGVIFAPVYISPVVYATVGYVYSPTICIDADIVTDHFFCRPAHCHYYFGDYYAPSWGVSFGITPWFTFHHTHGCYCPCYSYYSCHYARIDPGWSVRIRADFGFRVSNVAARPPTTFIAQQNIVKNTTIINNVTVNKNVMAKPLKEVAKGGKDAPMKFEQVDKNKKQEFVKEAKDVRKAADQRVRLEKETATKLAGSGGSTGDGKGSKGPDKPLKLGMATSPHVTKSAKVNPNTTPPAPPKQETVRGGKGNDPKIGSGGGKPNDPKVGSGQPGSGAGKGNDPKIGGGGTGTGKPMDPKIGGGKPNDPKSGAGSGGPGKPMDPKIGGGAGKPNDPPKSGAGSGGPPMKPGGGTGNPGAGSGKPNDPPKSGAGSGGPPMKPGGGTGNPGGGAGKPGGGAGTGGSNKPGNDPNKPNKPNKP